MIIQDSISHILQSYIPKAMSCLAAKATLANGPDNFAVIKEDLCTHLYNPTPNRGHDSLDLH